MDILFVRSLLTPHDLSGSRYPWEVSRHLAARGNRVRVITPRPAGPLPRTTSRAQLIHYPVSRRTPAGTFFTNAFFSALEVARQVTHHRPDVIVLSSYEVAFGNYLNPMARVAPSVYIYNSAFYSDAVDRLAARPYPLRMGHRPLKAFMRMVEVLAFRSAEVVVAVSPYSLRQVRERLGHTRKRMMLIPTGVDTGEFSPGDRREARGRLGLPEDATILLTVGRLARVKRFDRAIDAFDILRRHRSDIRLIIAGQGPEEERLRARAATVGDAITFSGFLDTAALLDHYRAADAVLCTSEFENWSVAILEAFACGVPVFGTPRGSIPDLVGLVDKELIFPSVEPSDIAAVLASRLEPAGLSEAGRRGREVVARFSWAKTAEGLEAAFEEAVASFRSQ